jgi:pimeloyl-ACP methyl ester carboxylesterase
MRVVTASLLAALLALPAAADAKPDLYDRVKDGYADNGGVRIHYVVKGKRKAPLVVMIHGFPDFWYTWRDQMAVLSRRYRVAAIDQRGYNLSDKPKGVEQYDILLLAGDVAAVIRALGAEQAIVVGHDWGAAVAWTFAIAYPAMTSHLVILNTPHPRGLFRELRENPIQRANSEYARIFQQEGAHLAFTAEGLSAWVTDPAARARYVEAFQRSDFEAMLNYYKRNYPREPYDDLPLPNVRAPVLAIHGLTDPFLLATGWNGTWQWLDRGLTLVTVPAVGHFVQQDASELVTTTIERWLAAELGR